MRWELWVFVGAGAVGHVVAVFVELRSSAASTDALQSGCMRSLPNDGWAAGENEKTLYQHSNTYLLACHAATA